MRVGFVGDTYAPAAGGGYVLQTTLERAIRSRRSNHDFIRVTVTDPRRVRKFRDSIGRAPSRREFLNFVISERALDLVWFLTPMAEPVCVPFIATVLDLAHRRQALFPEVSVEGWWTWEKRERTY